MFLSVISWQDNEVIFVWLDYKIFSPWTGINVLLSSVNILWRKDQQHGQNDSHDIEAIDQIPLYKEKPTILNRFVLVIMINCALCLWLSWGRNHNNWNLDSKWVFKIDLILTFKIQNLWRSVFCSSLLVATIETAESDIRCLDRDFVPLGKTRDKTGDLWLSTARHSWAHIPTDHMSDQW